MLLQLQECEAMVFRWRVLALPSMLRAGAPATLWLFYGRRRLSLSGTLLLQVGAANVGVISLFRGSRPLLTLGIYGGAGRMQCHPHALVPGRLVMLLLMENLSALISWSKRTGYDGDDWFSDPDNLAGLRFDDGLWWKGHALVVPQVGDLRLHVLQETHDAPYSGHLGIARTVASTERLYWWPTLK